MKNIKEARVNLDKAYECLWRAKDNEIKEFEHFVIARCLELVSHVNQTLFKLIWKEDK